jgi:subtilisin family serine protease
MKDGVVTKTFSTIFVRLASVFLLVSGASGPAQADAMYFNGAEVSPNRVLVKVRPQAGVADLAAFPKLAGTTVVEQLDAVAVSVLKVPAATEEALESVILELGSSGLVEYAEPDYHVSADLTPSDPRFGELWGLHNIGQLGGTPDADIDAPEAWDLRTASSGVAVVIDTGIDYNHVDLAANVWVNPGEIPANGLDDDGNGYVDDVHGINAITGSGNPMDDNFHGTHVSGTLGAVGDNASGVTGVSWNTQIMGCKFLNSFGGGTTSDAIECLNYVATMKMDHGVDIRVTNNSWGGGGFSQALSDAIEITGDMGILFVAAAGNSGTNNDLFPHYPSSYSLSNIIAVADTNRFEQLSSTSSFGPTSVDLSAPGSDILSTFPGNAYATISGTSMATPHVAGAAMLTWTQHPTFDLLDVKETLESTADSLASLSGRVATGGRLNLFNAMTCNPNDFRLSTSLPDGFEVGQTRAVVLTARLASCALARGAVVDAFFDNGNPDVALLDDGTHPDRVANDGTYSGTWIPIGLGPVTVTVDAVFSEQPFATSVDGTITAFSGVIDFEDIAVPPGSNNSGGDRRSQGYVFDSSTDHTHLVNDSFDSHNGTTWLGSDDFRGDNRITMSAVSGAVFGLIELDISELIETPNSVVVRVTGNLEGGGTVNRSIQLDDIADGAGPLDDFQTIVFDSSWTGLTSVELDAVAGEGDRWYALDNVTVSENAPPICSLAGADADELWPPNHKFRDVVVEGVIDTEGGPVQIVVTQIAQDEPIEGRGDGNTEPDAGDLGTGVATLRSEHSGLGDGRVYHVSFEAFDEQGASCGGTVTVCVPHDRGQGSECVDQGPLFDSITGLPLPQVIGPENGGFETGDFTGWGQINSGSGGIVVDDGSFDPPGPGGPVAPFAGGFSAATFQGGPGVHTLFQDVTLSVGLLSATLLWGDNLQNHAGVFVDPLQEWRVEVWDPADNSVLAELFSTEPGDPPIQGWTERAGDLSPWIGQTIRIAFTQQDALFYFNARLDEVRIVGQLPLPVTLDIRPGNTANFINPMGSGTVPVAILGSETFVVAAIDSTTLAFGPNGAGLVIDRISDVNGDGAPDLVSEHPIAATGIAFDDDLACISGATIHGEVFEGCDGMRTVSAACGIGFELALLLPPLLYLYQRRRRR